MDFKKIFRSKKFWFWFFVILIILVLLYYFTYVLASKNGKVIYQDSTRRIYLTERKSYQGRPDREMWKMVYEDQKDGKRKYILGNSPKGFSDKKMSQIILNTIDQGKTKSFDQVQRVGITMNDAKTDIHSNLIPKKSLSDFIPDEKDFQTIFPV
jgi:hypothetical protein